MKQRTLSLLMALCLMLTLAPAVLAADTSGLQTLVNQANENSTITLTKDYTLTEPLVINKAITIDGGSDKHTITAPSGVNAINVTANNVTLKNLTINASGSGYGVNATGSALTVADCAINVVTRGINFYPSSESGANLTVTGTTIKNTAVSDYDTTANYGADNRGIATGNVKGGTVTIKNSQILGFKYSINAVVTTTSSAFLALRDGNGTNFDISNTTIKGWTALNIWSAATNFTFTNCTLVGISTLSGDSNGYSTIHVNDGIYGGISGKSSTVKFVGGKITAAKLGTASQTVLGVDYELQTKFVFEPYANKSTGEDENVAVSYYGPENTASSHVHQVYMWNFYPGTTDEASDDYMATMVSGDEDNVDLLGGTVDEYTGAAATSYGLSRNNVESSFADNERGGAN